MHKDPIVSIVVPMFNEERNIKRCLKSLRNQTYLNREIIVVDDDSEDKTAELALQYADRVIVNKERKGAAFARNIGIKEAKGDFIAFTDGDCVPERDWLEELLKCFSKKNIVSVGGPNLTFSGGSRFSEAIGTIFNVLSRAGFRYGKQIDKISFIKHNPTCNVLYKREIFQKLGLFNERFIMSEDEEMDYKIIKNGYEIFYTPYAKVKHFRKDSPRLFYGQLYKYSIGKMQLIRSHPDTARILFFIPSAFLIIMAVLIACSPLINFCYVILKAFLLLELIMIFSTAFYLSIYTKLRFFPYYLILLPLGFFACGIGFIRGLSKPI